MSITAAVSGLMTEESMFHSEDDSDVVARQRHHVGLPLSSSHSASLDQ